VIEYKIKLLKMPTLSILKTGQHAEYGQITNSDQTGLTSEKMALTNNAKFMHCLPVRRNVIVTDEVLDSENSIVEQANNRTYAAQLVLQKILENEQ
jgi:N-succinyl-L-ornithine transcarbamylase